MIEEEGTSAGRESHESAALDIALSTAPGSAEAKALLIQQTELAALQAEKLRDEMPFERAHLRFRQFTDISKSAFEIAVAVVVLLIVTGLGALVWNAMRDRDLVMEAFSVPPDVAQRGMTGAVLASRVLDKFGQMQADTVGTVQGAGSYRSGNSEEVRLEIPETGVSLSELDRYLRVWLGHEIHITGDLVHTDKGLALTVRYGAQPGVTEEAPADDLDGLVEKAAEHVYAAARPYRYIEYLTGKRRYAEALTIVPALAAQGTPQQRALAYLSWGTIYSRQFDYRTATDKFLEATRLDPENAVGHAWLSAAEEDMGHDEEGYVQARAMIAGWHSDAAMELDPLEAVYLPVLFGAYVDEIAGDYQDALTEWGKMRASWWAAYQPDSDASDSASDYDFARADRVAAGIPVKNRSGQANYAPPWTRFYIACMRGDWPTALTWAKKTQAVLIARPEGVSDQQFSFWPQWAYAKAMNGDIAGAEALIAKTPLDCDQCVRMRARIEAAKHDWREAARDFAMVSARSPHVPFADTDWGAMLLQKGDYDGAIAKFEEAHRKSPHFADPLEMWGEALMRKNRSDLALAKFEEADEYAPNWGRLHLEWGKALFYAGHKDEAKKEFASASRLGLSPSDRTNLSTWAKGHG